MDLVEEFLEDVSLTELLLESNAFRTRFIITITDGKEEKTKPITRATYIDIRNLMTKKRTFRHTVKDDEYELIHKFIKR